MGVIAHVMPEPTSPAPIRVLLVDDHLLLADALLRALSRKPDITIVGIAGSVAEARDAMTNPVDVVLLDYLLPDGTGADVARIVRAARPAARIVMLTALEDDATILDSVGAGADAFLTKGSAVDEVVRAIRAVHAGQTLLPRSVIMAIAQRAATARDQGAQGPTIEALTTREAAVVQALADGLSFEDICDRLGVAPEALRAQILAIMSKLHVHSEREAATLARRDRRLEPPSEDASG